MGRKRNFIDALVLVTVIAILVYVIMRTVTFLMAEYGPIDKAMAIILIAGEFFILLHSIGYALDVGRAVRREEKTYPDLPAQKPSVAILVAARHEPKEVLAKTFITLINLNYPNKTVYFLDDSSDEEYLREAEEICREYGLRLYRRKERHGAKAGIINDCLKMLSDKYVAIFDADQNPMPEFLNALIPILEGDPKLAFVQTPQFYTNIGDSPVSRGAAFQQAVFYEYICEGKSAGDAMFCCGTNIVFRRDALVSVGGFDESTVTEDFATSIKLHSSGWKSLYYGRVSAFGMAPKDLAGYFKQQFRWAAGTVSVFRTLLRILLTKPFSLNLLQWWEYLLSSTYYFIGISFFILMLCPVAYIFFKLPSFFMDPRIYVLAFIPYIVLSISVFYKVLAERRYKVRDLFVGQLLGAAAFSVYIRGAMSGLIGRKLSFGITSKTKGNAIPYIKLWPQISMMILNFSAVV
ncbi:MAG TPA: glycosyltransferase, partial [Candidatus Omnitrophota bacterium]|nr:glycosyltransferase [Candidatus Omnitrophota bacterium]